MTTCNNLNILGRSRKQGTESNKNTESEKHAHMQEIRGEHLEVWRLYSKTKYCITANTVLYVWRKLILEMFTFRLGKRYFCKEANLVC